MSERVTDELQVGVLLVDDYGPNLDTLEAILERPGYRLVRAQSAEQALLALLHDEFAAIVLDIQMPGINGLELARLIKERRRTRDVPILFLTAYMAGEQDVLLGYGAGAVDYLSKPVHPEVLRSKIAVFAELYRKTRELSVANEALSRGVLERARIEEALRRSNEELDQRVQQRTAELTGAIERERAARAEAERESRIKEEFLAMVSHELRTPLHAIYNWARLLTHEPRIDEGAMAKGLEAIERNARRQVRLIADLLDMSSIAAGKLRLACQPVNIAEIVSSASLAVAPIAQAGGVELVQRVDPALADPLSRPLIADGARLEQVLGNLLSNAVKFTPRGGRVDIEVDALDGELRIVVRDNGRGIDSAFLPHVFDRFRQADGSSTRAHGGLGLGLTIVRHLVELHGGTVTAASDGTDRGATFCVRLPWRAALWSGDADGAPGPPASATHLHDGATTFSRGLRAADAPAGDGSSALAGARLLVVDDEHDARDVLSRLLESTGARVASAGGVEEALALLTRQPFDAIVSDIGMPGRDGFGLIRAIRNAGTPLRHLPALALTAFARDADQQAALVQGFDDHLAKPVDPTELVSRLTMLLAR